MKTHRLKTNLLQQDVYLRDNYPIFDNPAPSSDAEYLDAQYVPNDGNLEYVVKREKYPITSEYVDSFCDDSAILAQKQSLVADPSSLNNIKPGLGDIGSLQELLNMDTVEASTALESLRQKYAKIVASQKPVKSEVDVPKEEK